MEFSDDINNDESAEECGEIQGLGRERRENSEGRGAFLSPAEKTRAPGMIGEMVNFVRRLIIRICCSFSLPPSDFVNGDGRHREALRAMPNLSEEAIEMLMQMYPKGMENSNFRQGDIGDCYALALLHALKVHPLGPYIFARIMSVDLDGFYFSFEGLPPVLVKWSEIDEKVAFFDKQGYFGRKQNVDGDLGDKVFERGFGKVWKQAKIENHEVDKSYHTMIVMDKGGSPIHALELVFGTYGRVDDIRCGHEGFDESSEMRGQLVNLFRDICMKKDRYLVVASTIRKFGQSPYDTRGKYLDSEERFLASHAYALVEVDIGSRELVVVDPHDTRTKEYKIDFETFFKYFDVVSYVQIDAAKLREAPFRELGSGDKERTSRFDPATATRPKGPPASFKTRRREPLS